MAISNTTFTKALLSKIQRGIGVTSIVPCVDGGQTFSATTFADAGKIYSIEGSFAIDWPEPDVTVVRIDQNLKQILMNVENGDITFSANYPTTAAAAINELFNIESASVSITSADGVSYSGVGISLDPKTTEVSLLVEDEAASGSIAFARIAMTARFAYDSDNRLWYIALSGRVLENLTDGQPDVVVSEVATA